MRATAKKPVLARRSIREEPTRTKEPIASKLAAPLDSRRLISRPAFFLSFRSSPIEIGAVDKKYDEIEAAAAQFISRARGLDFFRQLRLFT